jgi:hypothetical protein
MSTGVMSVYGHEHLDVAASYTNVANSYQVQDKYEEALEILTKSLDIMTSEMANT